MKKRIAIWVFGGIGTGHFSQGYPPLEKLLIGLADSFEMVIYSQSSINKEYQSLYFTIRTAPVQIRWGVFRWLFLFAYFFNDFRRNRFHLLVGFWGYPAGFLATCLSKIVRIPCLVYILGSDAAGIQSIDFGIFHKTIPRKLALWTYDQASLLLAISEFQRIQLLKYGVKKSIMVIPWGVEKGHYEFTSKKHGAVLRVIHVGHLTPVKDQATLLKTLAIIAKRHPVELRIFGADSMNGAIQKLSRELGLSDSVQFLDMIPHHRMPEQYAWADMMLHTSLSEGQSMALTEAAACGVLLAGTKVGLLYDLGDNCGISVEVGNFEELASKVLAILDDRERWNRKIHQAKMWSDAHDMSWTVVRLKSCLNTL